MQSSWPCSGFNIGAFFLKVTSMEFSCSLPSMHRCLISFPSEPNPSSLTFPLYSKKLSPGLARASPARCISRICWCSISLPFANSLPPEPGKCSCRCLVSSASKKAQLKIFRASRFRASLFGFHSFGSLHSFNHVSTAPNPYLRNTRPTPVLGHVSKQANQRRALWINIVKLRLQGL